MLSPTLRRVTILFVYLLCIIGLPLGLAIVTGINWQFRPIPTLIAACAGEIAGFVLLFVYAGWKAARVLSHKESGAVLYLDHVDLSTRIVNTLIFLSLALAIGVLVLTAHWMFSRMRSSRQ